MNNHTHPNNSLETQARAGEHLQLSSESAETECNLKKARLHAWHRKPSTANTQRWCHGFRIKVECATSQHMPRNFPFHLWLMTEDISKWVRVLHLCHLLTTGLWAGLVPVSWPRPPLPGLLSAHRLPSLLFLFLFLSWGQDLITQPWLSWDYVDQAGLKLTVLSLPSDSECWDWKHASPCLLSSDFLTAIKFCSNQQQSYILFWFISILGNFPSLLCIFLI